jgi:ferredoxin
VDSSEDFCVRFEPSGRSIRVPAGTLLLDAARSAGLPVASSCGADGTCAGCGLEILESRAQVPSESERERCIKARNRIDPALRLSCRITVDTDMCVTARYW